MQGETFSQKVRQEAADSVSNRRHCQLAEIAGLLSGASGDIQEEGLKFETENLAVAKKLFTLIRKTFKINPDAAVLTHCRGRKEIFRISISGAQICREVVSGLKITGGEVSDVLLQKSCCRRAFVRGSFLSGGSVTDPAKGYHLEIVAKNRNNAEKLCSIIGSFWDEDEKKDIKYTLRHDSSMYVVYVKEGDQISDLLNICECYRSLMEMENIRVKKEIANSLNRRQNCEMANMVKTISAAQELKDDIIYIDGEIGLENLPLELRELARLRRDNVEMSLKELGESLEVPIGKSCVNHRLRKIKKIAEDIRCGKEKKWFQ